MSSSATVKSQNVDYTHFVSLPLSLHPELVKKLMNFQNSIVANAKVNQDLGIERSMFIKPRSFHLTVLMLKLSSNDQIGAAAEVLRSVSSEVIDALEGRPVSIRLKGLDCMRGSPEKAYVVYAPVEVISGEAQLLRACRIHNFPNHYFDIFAILREFITCICYTLAFLEVIINAFTEAGLVLEKDVTHKLKLHATMMNARYRKSKNKSGKTEPFDARTIFGQYGSEDWGECHIREAHLSQRFVYDDNGYFHCCASIPFPEEKHGVFGMKKVSSGK